MSSDGRRDSPPPAGPTIDDARHLVLLGQRFAAAEQFDEAIDAYLLALRIDPKNVGVKLALAEARKRHRQAAGGRPARPLRADVRERVRREAIDAAQFLGLARIYADQGSNRRAFECLDIAESRHPSHPEVHKLRGRLLFRRKDFAGAAQELTRALRLDPFDRETALLLGRARYEVRDHDEALAASVHAYLLLNDGDREGAEHLRRRIRTLKQMLGWGNRELRQTFHERQEHLHVTFDRLEWHRERFLAEEGAMLDDGALAAAGAAGATVAGTDGDGRLDAAGRLRRHELFARLSDEQVFRLAEGLAEESLEVGGRLPVDGDGRRDLWVVEEGRVALERSTHYGTFALAELGPGDLLGAVAHLSPAVRIADPVALTAVRLLRIEAAVVDRLLEDDTELAVQLHWIFWRALAQRLRSANGQLEGFFGEAAAARSRTGARRPAPAAEEVPPSAARTDDTVRLFREQGLSHSELITLATFSREKRFPDGGYVFQEGDEGAEMYVVLEGRARISKYIPGGGEEALAIVGRGDFFGEMSMIDGEPRSADVRAHGGPLRVLALDQETVREVLAMDPQAALEFLQLLCRLITRRLREIAEKLVGWRILAGPGEEGGAGGPDRSEAAPDASRSA